MTPRARGPITVAIACSLAAMAVAPAPAADPPVDEIKVAKHHGGPYAGSEIAVNVTKRKSLYMRIKNLDVGFSHEITLTDNLIGYGSDDFKVRWYKGNHNVTHAVVKAGYEFTLKPGKRKTLRVEVKPIKADTDDLCIAGQFHSAEAGQTNYGLISIGDPGVCSG